MEQTRMKRKLLQQRPELIQRFIGIWWMRRLRPIGHRVARFLARIRMSGRERRRYRQLLGAVKVAAKAARRARFHNLPASESIYNLALYFLIAELDIQSVKVDALTHPDPWRRSLCSRVILLTLHELDLDKAGGSRLRDALEQASVPDELRREVYASLRAVRTAQQKAQKQFSALRDSTIAHRDGDAIGQYRAITSIDSLEIINTGLEFYSGVGKFMGVMPRLILHVGGWEGVVSQVLSRSRASGQ
jgi:hypothetical protein